MAIHIRRREFIDAGGDNCPVFLVNRCIRNLYLFRQINL